MTANAALRFNYLYHQYINKRCTSGELKEFLGCVKDPEYHDLLSELASEHLESIRIPGDLPKTDWDFTYQNIITAAKISQEIPLLPSRGKQFRLWGMRIAAAAIIIAIAGAGYLYIYRQPSGQPLSALVKTNSVPNYNKAILVSSNGQTLELDNTHTGKLLQEDNTIASNSENSVLSYNLTAGKPDNNKGNPVYHTLTTPPGGQYQLALEDGTRVWLNTSSTLTYPTRFSGSARIVELKGEAYFEVRHNPSQPFRVKTGDRFVEDLGTRFNINAYSDEPAQVTTLLEGAVKVSGYLLQPGEKAAVDLSGHVTVSKGNTAQAIAWKNGMFDFTNADLSSVMREIARWYNLKITYENPVPKRYFTGMIERSLTLDQVLKGLAHEGVNYRLEDEHHLVIIH